MRADPLGPQGASSSDVPLPPSSTGAAAAKTSGAAIDVPPLTTSDDLDIRRTLDNVLTVQAVHGQILVDLPDEVRALRAELVHFRRAPSPPTFDDGF